MADAVTVWTVGHSNRSFEDLIGLLEGQAIELVVDVRAFPGSRKHPQFGTDQFPGLLGQHGIAYRHEAALGGRRRPRADGDPSVGGAW